MNKKIPLIFCLFSLFSVAAYALEADAKAEEKAEKKVEPMHFESTGIVSIGGKNIEYTATAGTLVMKNEKDEAVAEFG